MIVLNVTESNTQAAHTLIEQWATGGDREYAVRRRNAGAAHNSLLARAVLRRLLADNDFDWNADILADEGGKPYIEDGPHISIAHSNDMVAVALCGEFAVGVDIEFWRKRDFTKLAAYAFGPGDVKKVADGGMAAFYKIWTEREAIAKLAGESVFKGMNGKDIDYAKWQFFNDSPRENYSLALASMTNNPNQAYIYQ